MSRRAKEEVCSYVYTPIRERMAVSFRLYVVVVHLDRGASLSRPEYHMQELCGVPAYQQNVVVMMMPSGEAHMGALPNSRVNQSN